MGEWTCGRGLAAFVAVAAAVAGAVSCSLVAPSDEELMGGGGGDASVSTDAVADDASRGPDASGGPGCTCVPSPPSGWALVALAPSSGSCPDGFGPPQAMQLPPADAGAPCSCECAPEGGTCDTGQVTLAFAPNGACSGASIAVPVVPSCATVPGTPSVGADTYLQVTAPGPIGCGATTVATLPPPVPATLCAGPAIEAGACASGSECVPGVGAPFMTCVAQAGAVPCPPGWPNAYPVASSFGDTRACTPCACGAVPCTGAVQLWNAGACNGAPDLSAPMDGTCDAYANGAFTARRYEAVITDGGCAVTIPSTLDGGLAPQGAQTVCCR